MHVFTDIEQWSCSRNDLSFYAFTRDGWHLNSTDTVFNTVSRGPRKSLLICINVDISQLSQVAAWKTYDRCRSCC